MEKAQRHAGERGNRVRRKESELIAKEQEKGANPQYIRVALGALKEVELRPVTLVALEHL